MRETASKNKKDGRRKPVQQKEGKRVIGEGLSGGNTVEVDDRRERRRCQKQYSFGSKAE